MARRAHLLDMSNHTIATPITTWAELRTTDREVLNRAEVAALLTLDPRTLDPSVAIPSVDQEAARDLVRAREDCRRGSVASSY